MLFGNDTGGWVARELALIDGARVSHLVLTNTEILGHRPPWIPAYEALAHAPGFGAVLGQLIRSRAFLRSSLGFGGCFHDPSRIDAAFRGLHAKLTMPTLFVWGAADPTFPESRAREMAKQFPEVVGFHSVPEAKLFFYLEQPASLADALSAVTAGDPGDRCLRASDQAVRRTSGGTHS